MVLDVDVGLLRRELTLRTSDTLQRSLASAILPEDERPPVDEPDLSLFCQRTCLLSVRKIRKDFEITSSAYRADYWRIPTCF